MCPILGSFGAVSARAYGLTAVSKPVVTGGTLASDSTYYYRTFTANGTLGVTQAPLNCDILVVSGGGSGGNSTVVNTPFTNELFGSGGGAGGLKLFSPTLIPNNYTVTIGAGGSLGSVGNASSLDTYATTGGGAFQTNGGSGGGDGYWNLGTYTAGAGISGEGNAGGTAWNGVLSPVTSSRTGGGGGSGAAGSGSNGGNGTNAYSSWATATGTGVSGRYAAGGAGLGGTPGSGGGGEDYVDSANTTNPNSATANTGSGGGGTGTTITYTIYGGPGGSGIIIVRYTKAQVD